MVERAVADLTTRLGRAPTVRQIGRALGLPDEEVLDAMEAGRANTAASLSAPRHADEDAGETLGSSIGVEEDGFAIAENRATYQQLSAALTDRERLIIELRFGSDLAQAEIGRRVGISQMQVSRLLRQALARLADAAAS